MKKFKYILWFSEISNNDVEIVGGKSASLGEMYNKLIPLRVNISNGFAITSEAYKVFIDKTGIKEKIIKILSETDLSKIHLLKSAGRKIRKLILSQKMPQEITTEIEQAYYELSQKYNSKKVDVAVRSSATSEDLPNASFAGQQESYLNISSAENLVRTSQKCMASLFTDRAISYRIDKGFDHSKVFLSVCVQKMVRSDKASSGVMFTIDTESGFDKVIIINSSYGLGENIVKGKVTPDQIIVFKTMLGSKFNPIISKEIGSKKYKLIYSDNPKSPVINKLVNDTDKKKLSLSDNEILTLAKWGQLIENHYKKPMDIEWAKDGISNKLFIVQARPETVFSLEDKNIYQSYEIQKRSKILLTGQAVGNKIGTGKTQIILKSSDINKFKKGSILVTKMTDPDWEPIMKIAGGIVTDYGGRTCHAAIVSRELGIPCIVGTKNGTENLSKPTDVTISCAEGETGFVYKGILPFKLNKLKLKSLPNIKTKLMLNLGNPSQAFEYSSLPNEGIGLAREEFIISNQIKIHPNALLYPEKIKNQKEKKKILNIVSSYKTPKEFFIDKLASGIAKLASSVYPKEIIVRLSDFKTNEYANLLGGKYFEKSENNPMIGFRGASRYYSPEYEKAFELECEALKKVREEMGLKNVNLMVPFCRTVEEGKKVINILKKYDFKTSGMKYYVMCEIPSNVILAEEFSKIFDGFSIGSNDLTQLILGLDRDSQDIAYLFDERNPAVKEMIRQVIKTAHKNNRTVGICGEAPSNFPDFAEFLVENGIDSISLEPDSIIKTHLILGKIKN